MANQMHVGLHVFVIEHTHFPRQIQVGSGYFEIDTLNNSFEFELSGQKHMRDWNVFLKRLPFIHELGLSILELTGTNQLAFQFFLKEMAVEVYSIWN